MVRKTEGVRQLVQDVLETFPEPYGEDIILDVCRAIKCNPQWKQRYKELSDELDSRVVNSWIGRYTKQLTSMQAVRQVDVKQDEHNIISSYTKLAYP